MFEAFLMIALMNVQTMHGSEPLPAAVLATEFQATQHEADVEISLPHSRWQATIDSAVDRALDDMGPELNEDNKQARITINTVDGNAGTHHWHLFDSHEEARVGTMAPRVRMYR